ncbi:MAG: outer membrane beta-barrel protein [Cruoricaptor ignavus]|nr:outer membrane beta-barrel protein [Cruoricaptor ignavus]
MKNKKLISVSFFLSTIVFYNGQSINVDSIKTKEIKEVLIQTQKKRQFSDKAVYTFDKEALEKARYSNDLLATLPELQYDPISNKVASIKEGTILFLINGIEVTEMQMRGVSPANVVKVEYFDIPPTRWATRADTVVNIITKNPENGYSYGADITSGLTTGFVNGSAYANYTKGKNNIGLEYTMSLRDYNNRKINKSYEYELNNLNYHSNEQQKDHFGYIVNSIATRYTNVETGKYSFQAKVNLEFLNNFSNGIGQSVFSQGTNISNNATIHNVASKYTNPTLDLYYSKNLTKKSELILNLIGSHYNTNSSQYDREWDISNNQDFFNNDMILKIKQNGLVGEVAYNHQFEKGKLNSGYKISNTSISNDLVNLSGSMQYSVNYLEQYLYSEYSGKWNKLAYRLGVGVININSRSADKTYNEWSPSSKIILSYNIKKNKALRFISDYKLVSIPADVLSSNIVQLTPNITRFGNPLLKPHSTFNNSFNYSWSNKYFDMNATAFYNYIPKGFIQSYIRTEDGYGLTNVNTDFSRNFGVQLSGSIKPFGSNIMVIKALVIPTSQKIQLTDGRTIKADYIQNRFTVSSEYKKFTFMYLLSIPVYRLNGAFLNATENANHFFIRYKMNNWSFSTGMYWMSIPSQYKTKSLNESLVDYNSNTKIYNNKNMFVIGLSYDFSTGKKIQIQKKLENSTTPATTF